MIEYDVNDNSYHIDLALSPGESIEFPSTPAECLNLLAEFETNSPFTVTMPMDVNMDVISRDTLERLAGHRGEIDYTEVEGTTISEIQCIIDKWKRKGES